MLTDQWSARVDWRVDPSARCHSKSDRDQWEEFSVLRWSDRHPFRWSTRRSNWRTFSSNIEIFLVRLSFRRWSTSERDEVDGWRPIEPDRRVLADRCGPTDSRDNLVRRSDKFRSVSTCDDRHRRVNQIDSIERPAEWTEDRTKTFSFFSRRECRTADDNRRSSLTNESDHRRWSVERCSFEDKRRLDSICEEEIEIEVRRNNRSTYADPLSGSTRRTNDVSSLSLAASYFSLMLMSAVSIGDDVLMGREKIFTVKETFFVVRQMDPRNRDSSFRSIGF